MDDKRKPADEVPPGTPQSGENLCPTCSGTGRVAEERCADCDGSGKVITLVGDA